MAITEKGAKHIHTIKICKQSIQVCTQALRPGNYSVSLRACTQSGKNCGNSFEHLVVVKPAWSLLKAAEGPSSVEGWTLPEELWEEYELTGVKLWQIFHPYFVMAYGIQLQYGSRKNPGTTIYSDLIKSQELLPESLFEELDIQLIEGAKVYHMFIVACPPSIRGFSTIYFLDQLGNCLEKDKEKGCSCQKCDWEFCSKSVYLIGGDLIVGFKPGNIPYSYEGGGLLHNQLLLSQNRTAISEVIKLNDVKNEGDIYPPAADYFKTTNQFIKAIHLYKGMYANSTGFYDNIGDIGFDYQGGKATGWLSGVEETQETYVIQLESAIKKIGFGVLEEIGFVGLRIKYEQRTEEFILPAYWENKNDINWRDSYEIEDNLKLIGMNELYWSLSTPEQAYPFRFIPY